MTDNELDDLFNRQLQEYEGDVPADMWQRIAADKRKRPGVNKWFYLLAVLMLIVFITGIYKFYMTPDNKPIDDNITADSKKKTESLNVLHDTLNKNESAISVDESTSSLFTLSKNLNSNTAYLKSTFAKQQITGQDGYSLLVKKPAQELTEVENPGTETPDHTTSDTTKTADEKRSYSSQITNNDSADNSLTENDDHDKFSLQVFVSPDIPFSNIQSSNKAYEKLLQNVVSMKFSYTIGAGISYALTPKISLATGIQYSVVNEKISFKDSALTMHNNTNHLGFLNIPFTINYRTGWTMAFQTSLKAGVLLNISSKYKGVMPDAFGELADINHNVYEKNTGTSVYTGVNFSKTINDKLDVFAEPYFRWQTKNIANNLQPFTRKINTAGLALGIQLKLYKEENK